MQAVRHTRPGDTRYDGDAGQSSRGKRDPGSAQGDDRQTLELDLIAGSISSADIAMFQGDEPEGRYPVVAGTEAIGRVRPQEERSGSDRPGAGERSGGGTAAEPQRTVIWFQDRIRNRRALPPGQRVLLFPRTACLRCSACGAGLYDECEHPLRPGVNADGLFRDRFHARSVDLLPIPEELGASTSLFAFDVATILRAFRQLEIEERSTLLVFGAGVPGILAAIVARRSGVTPILVDPVQPRLELARQLEVAQVVNPFAAHLPDDVLYATRGYLADAAIDTAGAENALAPLEELLAPESPLVLTAATAAARIPARAVLRKQLRVYGVSPRREDYREALSLLPALQPQLAALVSARLALSVVPETMQLMADAPESYLKMIVQP